MAARKVRWECPTGAHPAVLGTVRPRKNATVRYCLKCSEAEGVLVERRAPAVEKAAAAKKAKTAERAEARAERRKAAALRKRIVMVRDADGTVTDLDVAQTLRKMQRLPAVREGDRMIAGSRRLRPYESYCINDPVEFTLRHSAQGGASGRATAGGGIVLTISAALPREQVEELILHELVHYVLPSNEGHGVMYRTVLMRAAREWWPDVKPRWEGNVYEMDGQIWRDARALAEEALLAEAIG